MRVSRALSYGVDAAAKAAWVEGFFADGALLLIHDPGAARLLDGWVGELTEAEFTDLLPLVRRTFGTFSAGRAAHHCRPAEPSTAAPAAAEDLDPARSARALATVNLILGAPSRQGES